MPLSERERRDWLRLARTENIGPVTFRNLIARFGTASTALAEVPRMASCGGAKSFVLPDQSAIAQEIEALAKLGGRMIASCEPDFRAASRRWRHRRPSSAYWVIRTCCRKR